MVPVAVRASGSPAGSAVECVDGLGVAYPLARSGDADRFEPVAGPVEGLDHVAGRGARHVVFGRLASEQHDDPDAIGRHGR